MGVTSFLTLCALSLAITSQARNCSKPVAGPNMDLSNDFILSDSFVNGATVSFDCSLGYRSAGGSKFITCRDGNWTKINLSCERRNCGPLEEAPHRIIIYPTGTLFGDKAMISCEPGFNLVGKDTINCGHLGWLERLPECEVVTCNAPGKIDNGNFSPKKEDPYHYRDAIKYVCDDTYHLIGSETLSCSEDGTFKPRPPTCSSIICKNPFTKELVYEAGARDPYGPQTTVTLKCQPGYTIKGDAIQTCGENGQWSPGLPECLSMTTTTKATTTTTTTPGKKTTGKLTTTTATITTNTNPTTTTTTTATSTEKPKGEGNNLSKTLGIAIPVVLVIGAILTCIGCYIVGVPAFIRKRRGSQRGYPVSETTKDGEGMPLSLDNSLSVYTS